MIDIKGMDKAKVLAALHGGSHAQGRSFLHEKGAISEERARELVTDDRFVMYFDYVDGRIIKCNLSGDEFDPRLYDRDCGEGAAESAIASIREGE